MSSNNGNTQTNNTSNSSTNNGSSSTNNSTSGGSTNGNEVNSGRTRLSNAEVELLIKSAEAAKARRRASSKK
ncbi:hypothetical protein QM012_008295 [Aureobasidium pullulans]|uniref:BZIP domain-containing protein n=1 Tax=Aureobasidium pullulans TaxID=5580 RepID=A0ABR0TJ29_AURPU